ncbi:hypothetical protein ACHAWF_001763 [Thalassiosira exigua]
MFGSSRPPSPSTLTTPWHHLALTFLVLFRASTGALAFTVDTRHAQLLLVQPLSSSINDDTDNLLDKARKLREEVSAIESSKAEVQKEKEEKEQALQAAERKEQEQRNRQRMRYSVEVPILKDMGDEVMERVDFPCPMQFRDHF